MTTVSVQSENRAHFMIKTEDLSDASEVDAENDGLSENHEGHLMISSSRNNSNKDLFECWICKEFFHTANEFTIHLRSHNAAAESKRKFSCKICHKVLGSENALDRHTLFHSGARPFKCKYCSLIFTSSGNMHKHIRANHQPKNMNPSTDECWNQDSNESRESSDHPSSDSPTTSEKKRKFSDSEFNNNSSNTIDNNNVDDKCKEGISQRLDEFLCPVCRAQEPSLHDLEIHLAETHPEFLNLRVLMGHHRSNSSTKLSIPDLAGLIKESRIFSLRNAINLDDASHDLKSENCFSEVSERNSVTPHHQSGAGSDAESSFGENCSATDLTGINVKNNCAEGSVEEKKKREEFFSGLDLKTVSQNVNKCFSNGVENKDLADINSIITNTSTTHLITDLSKSPEPYNVDISPIDSSCGDEEQQDCFAAEFRKMKLRGEFPCQLCSAIFPNLRALKGHNRVHLNSCSGSINNPYRCNMCPQSSTDKSALLRHMRTHNGDRPFECNICRYAFTTKANCERHLRNRHAKVTRDDIRKCIIYHPSEDPTYDFTDQSNFYTKEEFKKSLFSDSLKDSIYLLKNRARASSSISDRTKLTGAVEPSESLKSSNSILNCSMNSSDWLDESFDRKVNANVNSMTSDDEEEEEKTDVPEQANNEETPLDLSVDVLDLSKKNQKSNVRIDEEKPQDLSVKAVEPVQNYDSSQSPSYIPPSNPQVKDEPMELSPVETNPIDVTGLYVKNQINQLYDLVEKRPFPPNIPPAFHSYFFPRPMMPLAFPTNINDAKEMFRGIPLNSRGVIDQIAMVSAAERIHQMQQQALAEYNTRLENAKNQFESKPNDSPPPISMQSNGIHINNNNIKIENLTVKPQSNASSSVKMVLKDGVLQAKPKQRRYRTERPFFCEYCSGRFTLRSNMERHIKQQHPQFWIQKQRGGSSGSKRGHPYKLLTFSDRGDKNKLLPLASEFNQSQGLNCYDEVNQCNKNIPTFMKNEGLKSISDEVRIAISLQLKKKVISNEENGKYYENMNTSDSSPEHLNLHGERMEHKDDMERDYESRHDRNDDTGNEDYDEEDEEEDEELIIDEASVDNNDNMMCNGEAEEDGTDNEGENDQRTKQKDENGALDLASVSKLLDNASTQTFRQFFHDEEEHNNDGDEEDEEGLVAGSNSEGIGSGSDENRSESEHNAHSLTEIQPKKKSAYSLAPNRVFCPYCDRKFPWSSSLRRHILTHTGQKPYKCSHCPLLFTTKSNCDRHLLRKHGGHVPPPVEVGEKNNLDNQLFAMRNVPERPYKCVHCPSSTFATLNNLKKHLSSKHLDEKKSDDANSGYDESQGSGSEDIEVVDKKSAPMEYQMTGDLPFKCYLCEGSYAERQEALDHIKNTHSTEFQLLVSKGALESNLNVVHEDPPHPDDANTSEENVELLKGKFPDYANRKVMCAFCLRRFWSAEDLRRHMRTHTGERPFSCDICTRKFTLKHSMLRHRKKHTKILNSEESFNSDEEAPAPNNYIGSYNNNNNSIINIPVNFWAAREKEGSDLISNLLGIHDKTIIDKMLLSKSAEDAARLLGVQK